MSLTIIQATEEKDLHSIYRLRYKIYCYEWGFEKPDNYPDEMVFDEYDDEALHFAVKDERGKIVGAISLILNSPAGFPAEKYCELATETSRIPRDSLAEISRLLIHRDFRRRSEDKYIYGPDEERRSIGSFNYPAGYNPNAAQFRRSDDKYRHRGTRRANDTYVERRRRHEVVISLYKALYQESRKRQITHWYQVMTKGIVILLDRFGIRFEAIGDPVDYRGIRTPYLGDIAKIEEAIVSKNAELLDELKKGL